MLYKINPIIQFLNKNSSEIYKPDECIDKSIVFLEEDMGLS